MTVNPIDQSAFDADPAMPITVTYGSNTLLTTLKNGQSLTPGNPTPEYVLVSGQEGVSLSADGKLTADWSKLHPGSYTIKVKRNGTIFYNEKVMEISLTVNKADQETIGMTTINLTPTYGDTGPVAQITGGGNSSYYTNVPFSASTGFTVDTSGYVYVDWSIVHASDIPYTASITAPGNNCYNEATVTFNVTVGKRKITVINPDDQTKVYDGTTAVYDMDSKPITTSITGYLSKDLATAGVDTITPATAAYDSVNVDEATTITLTYTEDAMKALIAESMWDNYIFDSSTQTNTASYITSKPVTVAVSAEDKVYDGEDDNVKVTAVIEASQLVPRDQSTIGKQEWTITDGAIDSDGDAGTRTVTAALTLPEALQAHSNYVFDSDQADVTVTDDDVQHAISITGFTMEVTKKPVAVTAVAAMKTYDGKKDNIEVTATIEASELVTKDQTKIGKQEWTVKDGWSETANAGSTTASANLTLPDELQNYMFDTGIADTTWKSDTELEISKVPLTIEKRVLSLQVADATFTGISGFDPAELEWADASEKVIYTGFVDGEDKTSAGITDPEITINTELIKDLNKDKETVIASALGVADSSGDGGTNYVFDYENVVCGDLTVIPIIYQPDEGTNSTWTTASTGPMAFSFSRSENDERAFDHCTEIKMDGQTVDAKDAKGRPNYIIDTEKEILKLQPIYLRTLSAGSHTLTVCFDDGENVEVSFTIEISKFTISFVDENGKVLQSSEVAYGNTPEYTGKTPTKQADEDYSYEFTGWTPEIKEVEGEATYTASFESFAKGVLTFDLGGETFIIKANIGDVIIVPPAPLREGYEFQYWEGSKYYPGDKYTVTGDHTLKAVYEKIEPKEENKPTEESEAGATTGDNAPVGFWVSLMLVSLLGILILQRVRSKRCS
ncbi:MAG: InlB B-repeat-containing protein [Firmicutes bacterium]|nr:InlB B-repeat-containing protein [Bacillota bacterium]